MSDTWGTLDGPAQAGDAAEKRAEPATSGLDALPAIPPFDISAAGSPLAAETVATVTDPQLARRHRQCATWCGYLAIAIGCLALVGWLMGSTILASIRAEWVSMKVNTAIGVIASGCALCLNVGHPGDRKAATDE